MRLNVFKTLLSVGGLSVFWVACPMCAGDIDPDGKGLKKNTPPPITQEISIQKSARNHLKWKRYRAFEQDLMQALVLKKEEVCQEVGLYGCVDSAHLVALGGNEPFMVSMYEPLKIPSVVTPIAVDRVVLSACKKSVELDAEIGSSVFFGLDFEEEKVDISQPDTLEGVNAMTENLYKRLLGRLPSSQEKEAIQLLTTDDDEEPVSPEEFALMSCFVVATQTEFMFY